MTLIANQTLAESQARQNLIANLEAADRTQPDLRQWVADQMLNLEWVFARDQSLTGIDEFGQWWSGCSVPTRAAEAMLKKLEIKGAVGCFLAPTHPAQLRTALDRLRPEQAIVAIVPEHRDLAMLLHCDDLSEAIASHRLWLAAGPAWDVGLRNLFDRLTGLAVPTQFIRTPDADPHQIQQLISTAQQIFSEVSASRAAQLESISRPSNRRRSDKPRLCVVAPSRFRLWNDLGDAMVRIFHDFGPVAISHFDADDPLCSSPLALVTEARNSDALLTANTGRSDLPGLIPESIPWLTWVTGTRIPSRALAGEHDHLLVADSVVIERAVQRGWPKHKVHPAGWPSSPAAGPAGRGDHLAIIVDTCALETPIDLSEYSSHCILWESIRHELLNDPLILTNAATFLRERMKRAGVGDEAFNEARFIDRLILPAYQQGLARLLLKAGLSLRLYGAGWSELQEFAAHAGGPIQSQRQLQEAAFAAAALVHVWPGAPAHPIEALGLPLIRPVHRKAQALLHEARRALAGTIPPSHCPANPLSPELILGILRSTSSAGSDTMA